MNPLFTISNIQFLDLIHYPEIHIFENETTFIQGESGCGKSSLLKLLNATQSPTQGQILFHEKDIATMDTIELRQKVQLVSQDIYLFDGTIQDNFNIFYDYRNQPPADEETMKRYLSSCCADFPLDTECSTMSGGERQRVFLAICLSFQPEVIMLDEPTSALDDKTANRLLTQIKEYSKANGASLIVICHDKTLTEAYADTVITLSKEEMA